MARGGYNGGSTIIGAGRSWSFDPHFDHCSNGTKPSTEQYVAPPEHPPVTPVVVAGGTPSFKEMLKRNRAAAKEGRYRDAVLAGIGRALPIEPAQRATHLKQLVSDGILLQTGAINIAHPQVAAWIETASQTAKPHTPKKKK